MYSLDGLLEELETRIPDLFKGLICPSLEDDCGCSYETGCLMLEKKGDREKGSITEGLPGRLQDDPGELLSMSEVLDIPRRTPARKV